MAQDQDTPTLLTPEAECAFVHLLKPTSFEGGAEKYSTILIFDKAAQATAEFKNMVAAAGAAAAADFPNGLPPGFKSPFRPSEQKAHVGFPPECLFITITTTSQPNVVGPDGQDIFEASKLYQGMKGRASLSVYTYNKKGNKGVSFGLNNFQKLADGVNNSSAGRRPASHDFGTVSAGDANIDLAALMGSAAA